VNRLNCAVPTSQYCIGKMTKNASTRLRWSPWRVGDSVKNSRSAKKEPTPNSTRREVSPAIQATQKTKNSSELVLSNCDRLSISSWWRAECDPGLQTRASSAGRSPRPASSNMPNTMTNNAPICWVGGMLRRAWYMRRVSLKRDARRSLRRVRAARTCGSLHPSSTCIGAPKVTEHSTGTGTTSPLGMTRCTLLIQVRHQLHVGELLRQVVQTRLEGLGFISKTAGALRETGSANPPRAAASTKGPSGSSSAWRVRET
jgi:hypothetical protein